MFGGVGKKTLNICSSAHKWLVNGSLFGPDGLGPHVRSKFIIICSVTDFLIHGINGVSQFRLKGT